MKGRVLIGSLLALVLIIGAAYRIVDAITPTEADVNHDGKVNLLDIGGVALYFGQTVPTPTPLPSVVTDRMITSALVPQLVNTTTGGVIAEYAGFSLDWQAAAPFSTFSCDGRLAFFVRTNPPQENTEMIRIIDTVTGQVLVSGSWNPWVNPGNYSYSPHAIFPCPLKNLGATGGGSAARDRVVVQFGQVDQYRYLRLYDLTSGASIFEAGGPPLDVYIADGALSCGQDLLEYAWGPRYLLRLADGSATPFPEGRFTC